MQEDGLFLGGQGSSYEDEDTLLCGQLTAVTMDSEGVKAAREGLHFRLRQRFWRGHAAVFMTDR